MQVQLMTEEEARNYKINPFDLTKVWYHAISRCMTWVFSN